MAPSHRKKQTRLTFNPLSSSSPAKSQYSPAIQERLSSVGYAGSSAKKRKVTFEGEDSSDELMHDNINVLPTPARSSQVAKGSARQASSSQTRSAKKKGKQGHIDFSNHIGTRLEEDEEDGNDAPVSSTRKHILKKNPFRGTNSSAVEVSSDSSSDDDIPHRSSPPRSSRRNRSRGQVPEVDDESEQLVSEDEPIRRSARKSKPRTSIVISSDEEGEAGKDDDWSSLVGSDAEKTKPQTDQLDELGEPETSGDEVMHSSPTRKTKQRNGRGRGKVHQIVNMIRGDNFVADDDEELEVDSSSEKKRKKTKAANQKQKTALESSSRRGGKAKVDEDVYEKDNFLVDDDEDVESCEEDDELPRPSQRRRRPIEPEDDSDDDIQTPAKRRRLTQKDPSSSKRMSKREEEDLAEDLEFLGSAQKSPSRLRSTASTVKPNPRMAALEEFKRRRAGQDGEPTSSTPSLPRRKGKALYDTDSDRETEETPASETGDDDDVEEIEPPPTAREMFAEDEEEEDWIEDDDDPLGVPDVDAHMPLAFSNLRFAKAKDLFKYAIEWMIQKKLNPGFSMTDEVYTLAFQKLNDEAQGLTGSKFKSSAWTPDFTRSLNARPEITVAETGADGLHHCEACNRKSHPATWEVQFAGKPYNAKTLEDLDQDDDEDDDASSESDEEGSVYDSLGNRLPLASRIFHLGRTCQENASTAHALEHWRYHLNEWVVEYLKNADHLQAEKIVERDAWKTKKRRKFANKVTDEMENSGQITLLYKVFKAEIEAAHEAKGSGYERYAAA